MAFSAYNRVAMILAAVLLAVLVDLAQSQQPVTIFPSPSQQRPQSRGTGSGSGQGAELPDPTNILLAGLNSLMETIRKISDIVKPTIESLTDGLINFRNPNAPPRSG